MRVGEPQCGLCVYVNCGSSMALSRWVHPMDSATCCLPARGAAPWAEDLSKESYGMCRMWQDWEAAPHVWSSRVGDGRGKLPQGPQKCLLRSVPGSRTEGHRQHLIPSPPPSPTLESQA